MRYFLPALAVWLCTLHLFFRPEPAELIAPLAKAQLTADRAALRQFNPEWDLMARLFAALAYANLSVEDPAYVAPLNALVDETEALERRHGPTYFLLPYGAGAKQSLFVDGELALMLAARQQVAGGDPTALRERVARIETQLEQAPLNLAESYPDEGWTFCNSVAVAALKQSDGALGTDHSELIARWLASARAHLIDAKTGLFVSSFHRGGAARDGPEGSTIWLVAHMLQRVDPELARQQYQRAKRELGHRALGFGWASEWPKSWRNGDDIDSGPTIPLVDANAGSSGLALVAAAAFGDEAWHRELVSSLELAAFPVRSDGALTYAAGNTLADAVLLYSLSVRRHE